MKALIPKIFLVCCLLCVSGPWEKLTAQIITDSENSANFIALQISNSSGQPAANYRNYAGRLAKTLAQLDAEQQRIVFGDGGQIASGILSEQSFGSVAASSVDNSVTNDEIALGLGAVGAETSSSAAASHSGGISDSNSSENNVSINGSGSLPIPNSSLLDSDSNASVDLNSESEEINYTAKDFISDMWSGLVGLFGGDVELNIDKQEGGGVGIDLIVNEDDDQDFDFDLNFNGFR